MELSTQIFQFILSISILVVLHELGHFIPAKYFKTKVEKFYLFFDPWFSLVKKKVGGTEYGIGWLPLGGYVKIAGMVDESMDTEQLKKPAEPWEFRSKPAWQRLIIMLGGVTVNFFLAWFIYSSLSYFNGETYTDMNKFDKGLSFSEAGTKMGFQQGDKIIKIDGKPVERLETSMINILFSNNVTVIRNGQEKTFAIDEHGIADVIRQREAKAYLSPRAPMILDSIVSESAQKAGLQKGDKVIAVNSVPTPFYDDVQRELTASKGKKAYIYVTRNGQPATIEAPVNAEGKLGVGVNTDFFQNITTTKEYSFTQSIGRGLTRTIDALTMQIKQFKIMFSSKVQGYKNVSGPIGIVKMMPAEINWPAFWSFTAMFSVWLAFLNLLPIPGLDGGHVMFTLWEMITGKPVPQKVLENAQMIGVIFLLGLMLLIFGSDIYKVITGKL